jgi:hypothetical protein
LAVCGHDARNRGQKRPFARTDVVIVQAVVVALPRVHRARHDGLRAKHRRFLLVLGRLRSHERDPHLRSVAARRILSARGMRRAVLSGRLGLYPGFSRGPALEDLLRGCAVRSRRGVLALYLAPVVQLRRRSVSRALWIVLRPDVAREAAVSPGLRGKRGLPVGLHVRRGRNERNHPAYTHRKRGREHSILRCGSLGPGGPSGVAASRWGRARAQRERCPDG